MKKLHLFPIFFLTLAVAIPVSYAVAATRSERAATPSVTDLQEAYQEAADGGEKVRILLVPGHEPTFGGAEFKGVYERELTVAVADELAARLRQNPRFEVIIARTNTAWHEDIGDYFEEEWEEIEDFVSDAKRQFARLVRRGQFDKPSEGEQVAHASAPSDVALRLYGINRWVDDNDIDLAVHLHFNDAPDHGPDEPSAHSGAAIYVPDHQYGNAATSRSLAESVFRRINVLQATSTLPIENQGIPESHELIAIGAYNTVAAPSILIEYAYITEPKIMNNEVTSTVLKDFAYATHLGLQDFFSDPVGSRYPTLTLPTTFTASSTVTVGSSSPSTYALQAALRTLGYYPAATSSTSAATLTSCPVDGVMGTCTTDAIRAFQEAQKLEATGLLGPQTLQALNARFSPTPVPSAPVAGACALPEGILALGAQGQGVTELQKILAKDIAIYPEALVTGYLGPATVRAVGKFQVANSIAQPNDAGYGQVGPKTRAALCTK